MNMNGKLEIKHCPNCGSNCIQPVVRDITRQYKGQVYTVPALAFYECANCGEKVYDHKAMRKIQRYSPAYQHVRETVPV